MAENPDPDALAFQDKDAPPRLSWPHAPVHRLSGTGTFMVTAATYHKEHHFRQPGRTAYLHDELLRTIGDAGWRLDAWAVFSNHYHFIGHAPREGGQTLRALIQGLHSRTAQKVNDLDAAPGRRVWFNYWDTRLTFLPSYYARLRYVQENPVRHGMVEMASQYPWGSAAWFERNAPVSMQRRVYSFSCDKLKIPDDY